MFQRRREQARKQKEMVNLNAEISLPSRAKRRKLVSKVWEDYTKDEDKDGKEWATCKHCKKKFVGSSKSGTTHLKNHLERCPIRRNGDEHTLTTPFVIKETSFVIHQEIDHQNIAGMIANCDFASLNSIKSDLLHVYEEEKVKLRSHFSKQSCRAILSIEFLESTVFNVRSYYCLSVHFIDDLWKLKKKILGLVEECDGKNPVESVKNLLLDWNISMSIFSVMAVGVYGVENEIKPWLRSRGSLPFGEDLLLVALLVDFVDCAASTREELGSELIQKIRQSLEYLLKTSSKAESLGFSWKPDISNFKLLETALELKEAFCELEQIDVDFKSRRLTLTRGEWDEAAAIFKWLEMSSYWDDTYKHFGSRNATANVYFPKVCEIFMQLLHWKESDYHNSGEIVLNMIEEFVEGHWNNFSSVLEILVILDPRFKMDIVEHWYKEIYGDYAEAHLVKAVVNLTNVYNKYATELKSCQTSSYRMLDPLGRPCPCISSGKNTDGVELELDRYLKATKFASVEEFDILAWWHVNTPNYPTLAKMARDFLAIPFSSALSDSTCRSEIRTIVNSKDLDSDILQALVCTKFWL